MSNHTRRTVLVFLAALLPSAAALATPSSVVWINNTDTQKHGTLHLGIDNFVATRSGSTPLSADLGATFGLAPVEGLGLEVGVDWWANAAAPLWLNAKLGTPEGKLRPAFAIGGYGLGFQDGARNQVIYALAAKTLGPVGRLTLGAYHAFGSPSLFSGTPASDFGAERTGAIVGLERNLTDKLWIAADVQTGRNAFSAASLGASYKVSDNASVMVGYNRMFDRSLPDTVYVGLDADLDLFGGDKAEAGAAESEPQAAPDATAAPRGTEPAAAKPADGCPCAEPTSGAGSP